MANSATPRGAVNDFALIMQHVRVYDKNAEWSVNIISTRRVRKGYLYLYLFRVALFCHICYLPSVQISTVPARRI